MDGGSSSSGAPAEDAPLGAPTSTARARRRLPRCRGARAAEQLRFLLPTNKLQRDAGDATPSRALLNCTAASIISLRRKSGCRVLGMRWMTRHARHSCLCGHFFGSCYRLILRTGTGGACGRRRGEDKTSVLDK
jgi:hypothetical protein